MHQFWQCPKLCCYALNGPKQRRQISIEAKDRGEAEKVLARFIAAEGESEAVKRTTYSEYCQRLTRTEVAGLWFRRGEGFDIQLAHPDFPKPAPDGLYLRSQVEGWFDRLHGVESHARATAAAEEQDAMRAARGDR